MDFSNLKKIFYIVAIISMLLSIKSRVFATSEMTIDDFPTIPNVYDNQNFIIAKNSAGTYYYLFILNSNISDNSGDYNNVRVDNSLPGIITFSSGSGQTYRTPVSNASSWDFFDNIESSNHIDRYGYNISELLISSIDIYDPTGNVINFQKNFSTIIAPSFDNVTEIENGNPDGVYISPADFLDTDNLYFHLLQIDTGLSNSDQSIYYYSDKTFLLNKDSDYYKTWVDPNIEGFYYYIPRYKLGLSQNTSYLYVLNNSKNQIQNSQGIYEKDVANGIYDVLQSDTAGVISATEEQSDRLHNIEVQQQEALKEQKNFQDTLTDTNIQNTTENEVDTSLNYSSDNQQLNNVFTGFFSRLSTWLSQFLDYDITQDTTLNIPIPHSEETITLHSNILYNQLHNTALYPIIYTFYMFIFMTNLVLFYTKVYARLVTGGYLNNLKNPITDSGIDKTIL